MNNDKKNIELVFKYLNNELSDVEKNIFDEKLKTERDFVDLFDSYKKVWELSNEKIDAEVFDIDIEKEWFKFRRNIKSDKSTKIIDLKSKKKNGWKYAVSIAASVIVFIGLFFIFNNSYKNIESGTLVVTTQLPDNSEIVINRNSKIKYPKNFKENRIVKLSGDAYFKVEPDTENVFVVEAGKYRIEVVGTEFYVNSDSINFEVVVEKGKVKVYNIANSEQFVLLSAGEKTIIKNNVIEKKENKNKNFIAWKTNKIVIDNLELIEISRIIEKTYGVKISFSDTNLKELKMTATFENQSLQSVIKVVEATLDVKIVKQGEKYIIINN